VCASDLVRQECLQAAAPPELHILGEIKDVLFPASAEEFEHEAEHYKERIQNELEALMLYRAEAT